MYSRREYLLLSAAALLAPSVALAGVDHLPLSVTFLGQGKFHGLMARARREKWSALPMGQRMDKIGRAMLGVAYVGNTLEIDDRTECPSVNLDGVDCWTYFEAVLGIARMLERGLAEYQPADLLQEIQWTRYRGGRCTGSYLERIHYLNEWFMDNEARGNVTEITRTMSGAESLTGRESREMTKLWQNYRYLKHNPALRPGMATIENEVTGLPVRYIPKARVAGIESKLQAGDIAGIVTRSSGTVCSHVGLITIENGKPMFMHASRNFRKVVIENSISEYLNTYTSHAGLMIARPLAVKQTITSASAYSKRLAALKKS